MTDRPRKRLIFLHPSDELYGADRMLLLMLEALPCADGVEVWLPNDLEHPANPLCAELERTGWTVRHEPLPIMRRAYRNPRGLARLAQRALRLRKDLRAAAPALVYCTTSAAFLGVPVARMARVPRVLGHVQEIWSKSDAAVLGGAAASCHHLLAISHAVKDALPPRLQRRTHVVLNATAEPKETSSLDGRTGPLEYVVASRWNGWKGLPTLLAAWDRAGAPGHLTVLGGPPLSGDRVDVPAEVAKLSRADSVTVVGEVVDAAPYLDAADVVLLPSDQPEPFGLVVIEAFARGRPVIASSAGGPMEIVSPERDGWLFPPRDSAALAAILERLGRPEVTAAGRVARETFEQRFTVDRWASEWRSAVLGQAAGA